MNTRGGEADNDVQWDEPVNRNSTLYVSGFRRASSIRVEERYVQYTAHLQAIIATPPQTSTEKGPRSHSGYFHSVSRTDSTQTLLVRALAGRTQLDSAAHASPPTAWTGSTSIRAHLYPCI
jgi:hypothetical protein